MIVTIRATVAWQRLARPVFPRRAAQASLSGERHGVRELRQAVVAAIFPAGAKFIRNEAFDVRQYSMRSWQKEYEYRQLVFLRDPVGRKGWVGV